MRNPLKRRPSTDPKPSLRERLRATKAKAGRVLAVNRILLKAAPKPGAAIDRPLLTNYSTFLKLERERVCAELYPHMGTKAAHFTLALNAAWGFFYTTRGGTAPRPDLAPASSRAARVLDAVGIDWRADRDDTRPGGRIWDDAGMHDDGKRPPLPFGWPAPGSEAVEALSDIVRLEATMNTMPDPPGQEASDLPEFQAMMDLREVALTTLCKAPAESFHGLQAKAKALLDTGVGDHFEDIEKVAMSLARDLLGLPQSTVAPQPDPIFAAIEEARRLFAVWDAAGKLPPVHGIDPHPEFTAGSAAFHRHIAAVLLKTVPRTAEGCAALARYCGEVYASEGFVIDENERADQHLRVLALIARSPLL